MNVLIRELEAGDFEGGFEECLEPFSGSLRLSGSAILPTLEERRRAGIVTLVAIDPETDRVVGTASVVIEEKLIKGGCRAARIEEVAVLPSRREKGVGRKLVLACVDRARAAGCYKVVLNCAPDKVAFYGKCGFRETPDAFMRLDLSGERADEGPSRV